MEAQLRSYLNDHATAWWAYMKKGEWAEQIGSFTRDTLYITLMFVLIPAAALLLYSLLVISGFLAKGFNLIAAAKKESPENKLSFFTFMSQWFAKDKQTSASEKLTGAELAHSQENSAEVKQNATIDTEISSPSYSKEFSTVRTIEKPESLIFNRPINSTHPNDIADKADTDFKKEVGLYQTNRALGEGVELYGTFKSQSTNKLEEDSPF